ncbi:MAG: hypothetical protein LBC02_12210 [Planctomycetaceae bacterium]|jgi:hypothetical protein|nr:hypothetical protein [Planctomycetaceae bacterium]
MKAIKIYLDTSVISMLDNSLRGMITREFFEFSAQKGYQFVISEVVKKEIDDIPEEIKRETILQFLETLSCVLLPYNQESIDLAWTYVSEGILTDNHIDDLTHIAYTTVFDCDVIVSWNRKHIANPTKMKKLNDCNLKNNYSMIAIYTPQEFLTIYK